METERIYMYVGVATFIVLGIVIIFALFKIHSTIKLFNEIANDTLKRVDDKGVLRWSRTSLTMITAWVISIYMAMFDMVKNGFNLEVFLTLVGVALGSKIADGFSKKLDPTVQPPINPPKNPPVDI